jgi:hypothetical protein
VPLWPAPFQGNSKPAKKKAFAFLKHKDSDQPVKKARTDVCEIPCDLCGRKIGRHKKLAAIGVSRFWPEANNGKGTDSKLFNCSFRRGKNLYPVVNRATGFVAACFGNGCAAIS